MSAADVMTETTPETPPTTGVSPSLADRVRSAASARRSSPADVASAPPSAGDDSGDDDGRAPFQRKTWDELSPSYRRELERRGQTRERHDAGEPPPRPKDSAPKRGKGRKAPPRPEPERPKRPTLDQLRNEVAATVGRIGLAVTFVDKFDGFVIVNQAEDVAAAAVELAEVNPNVRRTLERLTEVSGYAALATIGAKIAVPILMHHRVVPASPQVLSFLDVPEAALKADPELLNPPPPADDKPPVLDPDEVPTGSTVGGTGEAPVW